MTDHLFSEANKDSSGDPLLTLLTISHSMLEVAIRCVENNEDVVSRTNTYKAYPFEFVPPELSKDGMKPGSVRIGNVDGVIVQTLRTVAGSAEEPVLTFEFVFGSDPDTVVRVWPLLMLTNAKYDDVVQGDMTLPDLVTEPMPGFSFTPASCPGLVF